MDFIGLITKPGNLVGLVIVLDGQGSSTLDFGEVEFQNGGAIL